MTTASTTSSPAGGSTGRQGLWPGHYDPPARGVGCCRREGPRAGRATTVRRVTSAERTRRPGLTPPEPGPAHHT